VRLPTGGSHDRRDGGAARPVQQSQHPRLLRIRPPGVLPAAGAFGRTLDKGCASAVRPRLRLDMQNSSHSRRRNIAPLPPNPAEAQGRWRGRGASRSGSLSVTTTHALFALKVQRKESNGVAGLAAAGSSLDRQKSRQFLPSQDRPMPAASIPADTLALGLSCVSHTPQFKRE